MTVLLRAALVIGALSYLALMRDGADPATEARRLAGTLPGVSTALPAVLDAIPPETRERAVRGVLARGLIAELSRRAGADEPDSRDTDARGTDSRDTLEDGDRRPAWRGAAAR